MAEHVVKWVERHDRALGRDSEQALEAVHSSFGTLWKSFIVKDDSSVAYLNNTLKAILKFNADQTNPRSDIHLNSEE